MKRWTRMMLRITPIVLAVLVAVPLGAHPAQAVYFYRPGDPMNRFQGSTIVSPHCTGAWGVRGIVWDEPYLMTAGHCYAGAGIPVAGTDGEIGITAYSLWISSTAGY